MKPSAKIMPAAAAFTAISTLACCLPLSLSAAFGLASLSVILDPFHGWLIGISIVFLALGVLQLYRFKRSCRKTSISGNVVFVLAAIIVFGVALFPQVIAVVLADLFP